MRDFNWMEWNDFANPHVPEHTHAALVRYLVHRCHPGGCVQSILEGDLYGAARKADADNTRELAHIARWIMNNAPVESYGSVEAVKSWLAGNRAQTEFSKDYMWDTLRKEHDA